MNLVGKKIVSTRKVQDESIQVIFEDGSWLLIAENPWTSETFDLKEVTEKEEVTEPKKEVAEPVADKAEVVESKEETKEDTTTGDGPWTEKEILDMDREECIETIDDEELDIDPEDYPKTKALRKALIKELVD